MNYIAKRSTFVHSSLQGSLMMDGSGNREIHIASRHQAHGQRKYEFRFQDDCAKEEKPDSIVYIIDADTAVRDALQRLMKSMNLHSEVFESPDKFLETPLPDIPSCLVLDVRLPGLSGLDLQCQLAHEGDQLPIIFMTSYGDISMTVRAMKAGAVDFITKPYHDQDVLDAVMTAIERDKERRNRLKALRALEDRFLTLTEREQQVMLLVTEGLMNKQIAGELGLREVTIKLHRGRLMRKLSARTLPDLVRMADLLNDCVSFRSEYSSRQ
ncbi:response regulator [Rhizobium sp. BK251]|uniref:response regulator transcription factor n=1 Tax=Rhizobium sp. BK251 TaxID=2512125 RepID=UPI0010D5355F|nr:response regulator [Rhizobium sp. BK251]TCL62896.1 LuxR family two component transcriptional regulator [Rhizobium sp. BK251]